MSKEFQNKSCSQTLDWHFLVLIVIPKSYLEGQSLNHQRQTCCQKLVSFSACFQPQLIDSGMYRRVKHFGWKY